jgi:hypothetical protein
VLNFLRSKLPLLLLFGRDFYLAIASYNV